MITLPYIYMFALVFGGVLLVASIVLGGGKAPDVDASIDADVDADVDAEADTGGHGDLGGVLASLLSLRFWMFFFAFFGATGWLFTALDFKLDAYAVLGIAIGMGAVTGYIAASVLRALSRGGSGDVVTSQAYVGQTGRVLLPIAGTSLGKIRLQLGGTTVDVLARTDEAQGFGAGDDALVIAMDGTTAVVARLDMHNRS